MASPDVLHLDVRSRSARVLDTLLRLHDTPHRTAMAFAVGVFFSFSPFIGLQILMAMAVAVLFRFNRLAVFIGLNANLPWFIVPWYAGTTLLAAAVLGTVGPDEAGAIVQGLFSNGWAPGNFLERTATLVTPVLVPFLVGPTVAAVPVALVAYIAGRTLLVRRAARAATAG